MIQKIYTGVSPQVLRLSDSRRSDSGETIPIIEGQLSKIDEQSPNGYRYKKGFWDNVLSQKAVMDKIERREMLGMIEHPISDEEYMNTPYDKASHVVDSVWLRDSVPWGRFALINNNYGNSIKALVDLKVPVGVSTRGLGKTISDSDGAYVPHEGYMLISYDLTRTPNFMDLRMSEKIGDSMLNSQYFKELIQMYGLRDSADEHYDKDNLKTDIAKLLGELGTLIKRL